MKKVDFLPMGSVVILKGSVKKIMIVQRAMNVQINDKGDTQYFDYAGCLTPEGIVGSELAYFNHQDIMKVVFKGLDDDDDKLMVEQINDALSKMDDKGQEDPFAAVKAAAKEQDKEK